MADSQKKLIILPDNPLCGISTYKDTLNLATGACTRQIKKLVLTGEEDNWGEYARADSSKVPFLPLSDFKGASTTTVYADIICTHYDTKTQVNIQNLTSKTGIAGRTSIGIIIADESISTLADFKSFFAAQYAAGTPVTVWYVLSAPTTETIAVPSGLSGTEEGYLNKSGSPTPANPIYPTANNVEIWQHSLRKLTTSTDAITTIPADLYADGNNATVGLVGNMQQTGTPSPSSPIQPSECGERTGNLYNINAKDVNNGYVNNAQLSQDGTTETWERAEISEYIPISGDTAYMFNGIGSYNSPCYGLYDENKQLIGAYRYNGAQIIKFTSPNNARYFRFTHIKTLLQAMMVEAYTTSTMPDYEPYGIKIPISSANTTTPVYLGEVETTRQIKKLVLTGQEDISAWTGAGSGYFYIYTTGIITFGVTTKLWLSNQYSAKSQSESWGKYVISCNPSVQGRLVIKNTDYPTVTDFKTYLAQQYANGTPVTVWYVLATETTGIVNEPLRKIGDYADTVSGITIPTIAGKDAVDVQTTLKPSEVELTYTGWHDASVKEWDGSQWQ